MSHKSNPPSADYDSSKPVKTASGKRSVGTHKTASRKPLSAGQEAATYAARKANRAGRPALK
jgi:hypothetical protein